MRTAAGPLKVDLGNKVKAHLHRASIALRSVFTWAVRLQCSTGSSRPEAPFTHCLSVSLVTIKACMLVGPFPCTFEAQAAQPHL